MLVLVMGALLGAVKRTVTSCLRMTGRAEAANFATFHQILNRAVAHDGPARAKRARAAKTQDPADPATSWTKIVVSAWYGHVNGRTLTALYVRRWQIEVTFAETRAHLGVETQRQWSDQAIARTTPVLLGLYSLTSLCACDLITTSSIPYAAAWYRKTSLTFTDAIGAVRLKIWLGDINQRSPPHREPQNIPAPRLIRMAQALCFAA